MSEWMRMLDREMLRKELEARRMNEIINRRDSKEDAKNKEKANKRRQDRDIIVRREVSNGEIQQIHKRRGKDIHKKGGKE